MARLVWKAKAEEAFSTCIAPDGREESGINLHHHDGLANKLGYRSADHLVSKGGMRGLKLPHELNVHINPTYPGARRAAMNWLKEHYEGHRIFLDMEHRGRIRADGGEMESLSHAMRVLREAR